MVECGVGNPHGCNRAFPSTKRSYRTRVEPRGYVHLLNRELISIGPEVDPAVCFPFDVCG